MLLGVSLIVDTLNKSGQKPLFVFEGYMDLVTLKGLIEKKINELGYELVSLSFSKETLSIVVDKEIEIDMEMIVTVTNALNSYLDELNPFEKAYTLDISSLGAEKPLKIEKLGSYVGKYIHVHLINPIKGENIYEGDLTSVNEDSIILTYKNKTRSISVEITKANISKLRLAIKF
jgi:ribosome maturation factor RimP